MKYKIKLPEKWKEMDWKEQWIYLEERVEEIDKQVKKILYQMGRNKA